MDINEIAKIQKEFDQAHNWSLREKNSKAVIKQINKDLIGLYGEIGEFSNLIKKLNLDIDNEIDELSLENKFHTVKNELEEELIDSFIYLIRIATHLDMNISEKYLYKLNINKRRFKRYESKDK